VIVAIVKRTQARQTKKCCFIHIWGKSFNFSADQPDWLWKLPHLRCSGYRQIDRFGQLALFSTEGKNGWRYSLTPHMSSWHVQQIYFCPCCSTEGFYLILYLTCTVDKTLLREL
jgi:hypothetical protein